MFKVEGLYKTFEAHSANEVHAINGVDLVINDGDFITHRIISDGDDYVITKGDANNSEDVNVKKNNIVIEDI